MEKKENILWVKGTLAALCGAFTAAFGWLGWLVLTWAACMALDWVSGSAAAASRGAWSSAAARAGIWHKAGMVVVVLVCALTDAVLTADFPLGVSNHFIGQAVRVAVRRGCLLIGITDKE